MRTAYIADIFVIVFCCCFVCVCVCVCVCVVCVCVCVYVIDVLKLYRKNSIIGLSEPE